MPKYEYACKSCGERIEVKQTFDDAPLTECPACGGPLRKVFSSPAIVLRGPGFYRTDHRSPYRPDGVLPGGKEKDRDPSESKSSSDSKGGDSKDGDSASKSGDSASKSGDTGSKSGDSGSKGGESKGSKDTGGSGSSSGSSGSSGESGGSKDAARTA